MFRSGLLFNIRRCWQDPANSHST